MHFGYFDTTLKGSHSGVLIPEISEKNMGLNAAAAAAAAAASHIVTSCQTYCFFKSTSSRQSVIFLTSQLYFFT